MAFVARITDYHTCPMFSGNVPHVGGPIQTGNLKVVIGGQPVACVGDTAICVGGPPDTISKGSTTVSVGGMKVARMGDSTIHGGVITTGFAKVIIGG